MTRTIFIAALKLIFENHTIQICIFKNGFFGLDIWFWSWKIRESRCHSQSSNLTLVLLVLSVLSTLYGFARYRTCCKSWCKMINFIILQYIYIEVFCHFLPYINFILSYYETLLILPIIIRQFLTKKFYVSLVQSNN